MSKIIENNNQIWDNASKQEKRIIIAKDALEQLATGFFKNTHNYGNVKIEKYSYDIDAQFNEFARNNKESIMCTGCAKTGLFIAYIMHDNHLTVKEAEDGFVDSEICERLEAIFEHDQLTLIEQAYEGWNNSGNNNQLNTWQNAIRSLDLETRYLDRNDGIILRSQVFTQILHNIIRNEGTFNPNDLTVV